MQQFKFQSVGVVVIAFIAAVLVATIWGAVVQTQFNLGALIGIGADIPAGLRLRSTLADVFSGFTPTYGGYVVIPALIIAFAAAWWVVNRAPGAPALWFGLAGGLAILLGIPLVNYLSPLALVFGAVRDPLCLVLMAAGGIVAGIVFACFPGSRSSKRGEPATNDDMQRVVLMR